MRLPKSTAVAFTPRRVAAPSTTSSWISVATWISSMNAAKRRWSSARPPTDSAASSVKRGRSRLPPASSMRRTASVISSLAVPNDVRKYSSTIA